MFERPHFPVADTVKFFDDFVQFSPKFGPLFESLFSLAGYTAGHHIGRALIVGGDVPEPAHTGSGFPTIIDVPSEPLGSVVHLPRVKPVQLALFGSML